MYKADYVSHTSLGVISMYITLNIESEFKVSSFSDLPKFKQIMECVNYNNSKFRFSLF